MNPFIINHIFHRHRNKRCLGISINKLQLINKLIFFSCLDLNLNFVWLFPQGNFLCFLSNLQAKNHVTAPSFTNYIIKRVNIELLIINKAHEFEFFVFNFLDGENERMWSYPSIQMLTGLNSNSLLEIHIFVLLLNINQSSKNFDIWIIHLEKVRNLLPLRNWKLNCHVRVKCYLLVQAVGLWALQAVLELTLHQFNYLRLISLCMMIPEDLGQFFVRELLVLSIIKLNILFLFDPIQVFMKLVQEEVEEFLRVMLISSLVHIITLFNSSLNQKWSILNLFSVPQNVEQVRKLCDNFSL